MVKTELYARDKTLSYDELYDKKTFETRKKLQEYATKMKEINIVLICGLDIQIETFNKRHKNAMLDLQMSANI